MRNLSHQTFAFCTCSLSHFRAFALSHFITSLFYTTRAADDSDLGIQTQDDPGLSLWPLTPNLAFDEPIKVRVMVRARG